MLAAIRLGAGDRIDEEELSSAILGTVVGLPPTCPGNPARGA